MAGGDKLVVLLTVGRNAPGVCRSALMFATIAAASGLDTYVYAVQEGVDVLVRGALDGEEPEFEGAPTISSRLAEAREAGARLQACEATAVYRGIGQDDLIEGARIVGGATLIALTLEARGVLSF